MKVSFENTSTAFSSRSDKELRKMHFLFSLMKRELLTKIGTFFVKTALKFKLPVKSIIKKHLFNQFCGGETLQECHTIIENLASYSIHTVLDYAAEGEDSEASFEKSFKNVLNAIEVDSKSEEVSFSVFKVSGLASAELLWKLQEKTPLTVIEQEAVVTLKNRVDLLCKRAKEVNVLLMVDAEESWIQDAIDDLIYDMMVRYNKEKAIVFNTFQMYRKDMPENLKKAIDSARSEGYYLGVKLVRGAYMDKERERASQRNYPSPIFNSKMETDEAFNNALKLCVSNKDRVILCCGSHNEKSNYYLTELMETLAISKYDKAIWFAQLYGMGDHISYNLASAGYNVAKYIPYGPIESVMPYLIRRAEENKAMTGQNNSRELEMIEKEMKRRGLR